MFRFLIVVLFVGLVLTVFLTSHYSFAVGNVKCEDGYTHTQWDPKDHCSNTRSSNEFKMLAYKGSLCELAKCVDMVECTYHDTVDWQKFKNSPAFYLSEKEYKEFERNTSAFEVVEEALWNRIPKRKLIGS